MYEMNMNSKYEKRLGQMFTTSSMIINLILLLV